MRAVCGVFSVAFRGDDFRTKLNALQQAFDAEFQQADTPFAKAKDGAKEDLFKDSATTGVSGAYYKVTIDVKGSFLPFGPSAARTVGALDRGGPDAALAGGPKEKR